MREVNTINRELNEGERAIDLSLRGNAREWFQILDLLGLLRREIGVEYVENPNSPVMLIGPHSQGGITIINIKEANSDDLYNSTREPWSKDFKRIGKSVVYLDESTGRWKPINPNTKEDGGLGDSLSKQLTCEIAEFIADGVPEQLPNMVFPTVSQASFDANSGNSIDELPMIKGIINDSEILEQIRNLSYSEDPQVVDPIRKKILEEIDIDNKEYKKISAALLGAKLLQRFRNIAWRLSTEQKTNKNTLVLNIHTALDRKPEKGGNSDAEVIIGTTRGLSVKDFEVEIELARYLKENGFGVVVTSLFPPPKEGAEVENAGVDAKSAYPGEEESSARFISWANENNVHPDEFVRDSAIERLGRLRGTKFMPNLRKGIQASGKDANIIQLEVVRGTLANNKKRVKLAKCLAEFCRKYFDN